MTIVKVWCEWDIGMNDGGDEGIFATLESAESFLKTIDWQQLDFNDYLDAIDGGLLGIKLLEVK
jgi:hypothetical protein